MAKGKTKVDLKALSEFLISGNRAKVQELTQQAVNEGIPAKRILDEGLIAGMNVVGVRFKNNEIYVPEVLIAARAMQAALDIIEPILVKSGVEPVGKVAIGTVKGDLHDIGKNLVSMMLKGAGFQIIDLGTDVPPEKFISAIKENKAGIVGMSALLTTTMPSMKKTIDAIEEAGLRDKVKVMIGGAPVTQKYADEIGADGYAPDAASAVDKAKELLGIA
ncbi:MAG: corrinoid protein [bacterium]